jgi:Acyltransferase
MIVLSYKTSQVHLGKPAFAGQSVGLCSRSSPGVSQGPSKGIALENIAHIMEAGCTLLCEYPFRKLGGLFMGWRFQAPVDTVYNRFMATDQQSPTFVDHLIALGNVWSHRMEVEMNTEDGQLADLAKSDEACIFIMNHNSQSQDPALMTKFATLLYLEYAHAGKAATCPRPNIVLNEDILLTQQPKVKAILEHAGAVGVDASLFPSKQTAAHNREKMLPLLKRFIQDQGHIFIFPEGKMAAFRRRNLHQRFQSGIGELVRTVAQTKKRVKVVPLGFAYNTRSKGTLGSIYIGQPIYFQREGKHLLVNAANITSETASGNYRQYFDPDNQKGVTMVEGERYKTLSERGQPLEKREWGPYIADVLCENLRICKEFALNSLPLKTAFSA